MIKILNNKYSLILIVLLVLISCRRTNDPVRETSNGTQLQQVLDRGVLRVVTDFNSTSYFIYRGQPMGYQYEMLQELADHLGVKLEVTVKNDLNEKFTMLEQGKVDLIAVNLTVTKERRTMMRLYRSSYTNQAGSGSAKTRRLEETYYPEPGGKPLAQSARTWR